MSEKKRGFLGRLFGGKEAPQTAQEAIEPDDKAPDGNTAETASSDTSADSSPEPASLSGSPEQPSAEPKSEAETPAREDLPVADEKTFEETETVVAPVAQMSSMPEPFDAGTGPDLVDAPLAPVPAPAQEPAVVATDTAGEQKQTWFQKLKSGLARSSSALTDGISSIFTKRKLDAEMLEELEDILIQADLGVDTAMAITERLSDGRYDKEIAPEEVRAILAEEVEKVLEPVAHPLDLNRGEKPHVVLMVGVNGTGKTTTIGKLSQKLSQEGKTVMLAAGDTFRAAAVEQLKIWGQRTGAEVIARDTGADAAGLAFDAMKEAKAKGADVLLIDTAGRLQNKAELMDELEKVIRVIKKHDPDAPHDVILTLDATTGQNALSQVEIFGRVAGVTGLVMTKLDGTARGGILVAIAAKHKLPVHFIGVGEGVADLEPFSAKDFATAIAGQA